MAFWLIASALLVESWLPGSGWRVAVLRAFGAKIGRGVVMKPGLKVKAPWRFRVGNHTWIGENVWIDNLVEVRIGQDVCISQGTYICTGSHDWSSPKFDLVVKPIEIGDYSWVGAMSRLAPGTIVLEGAVVALGATVSGRLESWSIHYSPGRDSRPRLSAVGGFTFRGGESVPDIAATQFDDPQRCSLARPKAPGSASMPGPTGQSHDSRGRESGTSIISEDQKR